MRGRSQTVPRIQRSTLERAQPTSERTTLLQVGAASHSHIVGGSAAGKAGSDDRSDRMYSVSHRSK